MRLSRRSVFRIGGWETEKRGSKGRSTRRSKGLGGSGVLGEGTASPPSPPTRGSGNAVTVSFPSGVRGEGPAADDFGAF